MKGGQREWTGDMIEKDHGCRAWLVLAGSFFIQGISMGTSYNVGLFVVEWMETLDESHHTLAWISAINIAILFGASPVPSYLAERFTHRKVVIAAGLITTVGYVSSAFATSAYVLFFTYGVLVGVGQCAAFSPGAVVVGFYFEKRRSMAFTLSSIGMGVGTMIMAPIYRLLISYYSWRGAMLLSGGLTLHYCVFGALFIPIKDARGNTALTKHEASDKGVIFSNYRFYALCVSHVMWSVGYTIFYVYLPAFNRSKGLSKDQTATMLLSAGLVGIAFRLLWTSIFTKYPYLKGVYLFCASCLLSGITMGVVPFMDSFAGILLFSCAAVAFISGISSTLSLITAQIFGIDRATLVFGLLLGMDGLGCLGGPPLAALLFSHTGSYTSAFMFGAGTFLAAGVSSLCIIISDAIKYRTKAEHLPVTVIVSHKI